jgi:hypothetical protein
VSFTEEISPSPAEMDSPARIVMTGAVSTEVAGRRRSPKRRPRMMRNPSKSPIGNSQAKDRFCFVEGVPDEEESEDFLVRSSKDMSVRFVWQEKQRLQRGHCGMGGSPIERRDQRTKKAGAFKRHTLSNLQIK